MDSDSKFEHHTGRAAIASHIRTQLFFQVSLGHKDTGNIEVQLLNSRAGMHVLLWFGCGTCPSWLLCLNTEFSTDTALLKAGDQREEVVFREGKDL